MDVGVPLVMRVRGEGEHHVHLLRNAPEVPPKGIIDEAVADRLPRSSCRRCNEVTLPQPDVLDTRQLL